MHEDLKLLVEWSSPWKEFVTAIGPALGRSPEPLEAEAHTGLFPYRGGLAAMAGEVVLLIALIMLPSKFASVHQLAPVAPPKYDVIYFSGNELPRTEDAGGARAGRSGRSGGREGHHASQVIRVARGPSLKEQVVDAPKLNLPNSNSAVANLLAYKSVPGPPPTQGMESSSRHAAMDAAAVPPPAAMQAEKLQSAPSMEARIIAPTPSALQHELTSRRVSSSRMNAVPPPVSAPREVAILNPKLRLPQSLVVPPAPSRVEASNARARFGSEDLRNQAIVPPAPQASNEVNGRQMASVGDAPVIAPPSQINNSTSTDRQPGGLGNSAVVAPTSQISNVSTGRREPGNLGNSAVVAPTSQISNVSTARQQPGSLGKPAVVAPPSQITGASSDHRQTGSLGDASAVAPPVQLRNVSTGNRQAGALGDSRVIPPPAQASGSLMRQGNGLSPTGSVVQPAPSASAGANSDSNGQGRRGPADSLASAAVAPTASASGIVLSARPGAKLGSPSTGSAGSLAMSPSGGERPGLGGTGGGSGISNGTGSGSSTSGDGPGAKTSGSGQGSSEIAHNGISPFPGTGGAGKGTSGAPALSGVSVSGGGNNTVRLPSFGTDGAPVVDPAHSPAINPSGGPGITVVATSHSGGAFNFYGALKGDKVYTIYIDTALGTAVMQFADPKSANESYPEDLTAPQALRAELPSDVTASRLVIACILDRSGLLKTPRVVEASSPELSARVMAELPKWKFRPVFRGNQPIEVNAILGFDIDTR